VQQKRENSLHNETSNSRKRNGECSALGHLRKRHAEFLKHIVRKSQGLEHIYRQAEEAEILDLGQRLLGLLCSALRGDSRLFGQGASRLVNEYGGLVLACLNAFENAVVEIFGRERSVARVLRSYIETARNEVQKKMEKGS